MNDKSPMPSSFKDGEFGYAPSVMFGGPIDGKRFKLPIMPNGQVPSGFGHPIRQPHETSPMANYARVTDEPIGGFHVFVFQGLRQPEVHHASLEETVTGTNLWGSRTRTRPALAERGE